MTPTPLALTSQLGGIARGTRLATTAPACALRYAAVVCALLLPAAARASIDRRLRHVQRHDDGHHRPRRTAGRRELLDHSFVADHHRRLRHAECQCAETADNPDINIEIKLTAALPAATAGTAEIWVGDSSCTNVTTRTSSSNTTCEKIASPSIQDFTINSTANSGGGLHYVVKADALTQPFKHLCDPNSSGGPLPSASNSIYVFLFTDPNSPLATCSLTLSERTQGPDPVTNAAASGGDGAVSLSWTPPSQGTYAPSFFQVLCSDDCGNPIGSANKQIYSTCDNGVLSRRDLTSGGSSNPGTDGGIVASTDMALMSGKFDLGERAPWRPNATSCPADMGTPDGGGLFGGTNGSGPLGGLNPDYICTDQIAPSATGTRIEQPGQRAGLSLPGPLRSTRTATPPRRRSSTAARSRPRICGAATATRAAVQGGCFIATAAFGSYENRWVWVLRDFRDQVLLEHDSGRSFVEWYYAHSPRTAALDRRARRRRASSRASCWRRSSPPPGSGSTSAAGRRRSR